MDDAQRDVIAFLRDPASYPPDSGAIEVIETHASLVFLAGGYAYYRFPPPEEPGPPPGGADTHRIV